MRLTSLAFPALLALTACATDDGTQGEAAPPQGEVEDTLGFEDFITEKKSDTGYIGSRAAELEASFGGKVRVSLPGKTAEELTAIAETLKANPGDWSHSDITSQVTAQMRFARNALKAQKIDLNLEGGTPRFDAIDVESEALVLHYAVTIESLVKFKSLQAEGKTPADLVGVEVAPVLPLVPDGLFERVGAACATDPDTGAAVPTEDLRADNFFFYFDPRREGCPLTEADLVTGSYKVESSLDAPTVYPEYDRLVADKKITMAALFGQIEHGELKADDWGFLSYKDFTSMLSRLGFRKVSTFPEQRGQKMSKRYRSGLVVEVDLYTPNNFADTVPREQSDAAFKDAMRSHEVMYYNGHAFYGSLKVLDDVAAYPTDTYQVLFMDACWSYAYYTKQIFRNKVSDSDPDGYALADVLNNTEPGITGSERTAMVMYDALFKGADAVLGKRDASAYSWNNLIQYMNEHAERRALARDRDHPDPEIYGVSGARTNVFQPGAR